MPDANIISVTLPERHVEGKRDRESIDALHHEGPSPRRWGSRSLEAGF